MKSAERYELAKKQIDGVLSRIFIHLHCKVGSHNPKGGGTCREIKKNPWFRSHILCPRIEDNYLTNSITQNGNRLNSLYWYNAFVRCTHLASCILQHGCKFGSWLMVNKISNQTVHHQSATKFAYMLQDIKNYQPVKLLKYLLHFWYCAWKSIIVFNHVNTDWLIISLLNTVIEKN